MSFFSRDCRVVPCVTCHVCASLAAKRCSDVVLVWMHLEITNNDLFATVTGDDGEDVNVHDANADSSSTAVETDVSDGKSDGKTEAKVDPIAAWEAQFRFKEYRLPQDSLELRERIEGWRHECKLPDCPSRRDDGGCDHTFPTEFRPDPRDACAHCGNRE